MSQFMKLFEEEYLECLESDHDTFYSYVDENETSDKQYSVHNR
jgi:hypothetical protein